LSASTDNKVDLPNITFVSRKQLEDLREREGKLKIAMDKESYLIFCSDLAELWLERCFG